MSELEYEIEAYIDKYRISNFEFRISKSGLLERHQKSGIE